MNEFQRLLMVVVRFNHCLGNYFDNWMVRKVSDKERLEQLKDAIAHELGLTDDWKDGTYLYQLMRTKSAFAVGTITLDDFKEIDEELLDKIFNAIEPFFIEQAERAKELENHNKRYREAIEKALDESGWGDEGYALNKIIDILAKVLEDEE